MPKTIHIDPVTRIEGHAKITIHLDDKGRVNDARFHVTQFRGFEKMVEGRPFTEMPSVMARICGICPVSHLIASSKACDRILAVQIPTTAILLRRVLNLAQLVQSHALNFFHLSAPDLLLGMDAPVDERNVFGVMQKHPELAKKGIWLRKFGQEIIEWLGGKRIHPAWVVPGGVNAPLASDKRDAILKRIPEAIQITRDALDLYKRILDDFPEETRTFANFPSLFMGLVNDKNELEHYSGTFRFIDAAGHIVADRVSPRDYARYIAESVEPDSYLKSPYYKPMGYENGMYRVGPLARLNIVDRCGTPLADEEWAEFRSLGRGAVLSSFHYHFARLIEILFGIEMIERLLNEPDILSKDVRAVARVNNHEGIGVSEAPRGTLIHHYKVDEHGLMTWANLIIATGHNNLAMNRGVLQVAKHFVDGKNIQEGMLNRVEAVVRAFDPCLSCSTHAVGQMPLRVELYGAEGELLDRKERAS
ncbi:MAG: Ni/Fe hydrogenase subunit alpha [bacterium]|nr:Ni/Fe hydrogenase subunit alpha [bacterium]